MIKIKKLLTSLAAIGLTASASSLVVSCGVSFNTLKTREIDPTVFKTTFSNNIQNWNMAATMQSNDFKILANTQDTLMTYEKDENGNYDLTKPVPLLAKEVKSSDGGKTWDITIRDDAYWYYFNTGDIVKDKDGKPLEITANDIFNTAEYDFDSNNGSELASDWKTFVGDDINQVKESFNIKSPKEFTITLKKPADYFNTALTTGSFAPTPSVALDMKYNYGRGKDYNETLLSGPYYVDKYKNSYELVLKRNKNYKDDKAGSVDKIDYLYSQTSDSGKLRTLFEVGDTSEASITPSDSYGYKHYVNNFDGLQKVDNNLIGAKYLWFNFAKQHGVDSDGNPIIKNDDILSNKALSFDSVRTLIEYGLDRAKLVEYFAGSQNEDVLKDFTADTFNQVGGQEYFNKVLSDEKDKAGNIYYHSQKLLKDYGDSLDNLISQVKKDIGNKKVTLTFLTSGLNTTTFNPYIRQMLDEFNDLNSPIRIIEKGTADDGEYQQAQLDGDYSMFITGETPTYINPMSFLVNLQPDGPMKDYNGMGRLFNTDGSQNDEAIKKYGVEGNLIDEINSYNQNLKAANDDDSFAQAEKKILFESKTILPLYRPNGAYTYNLSYIEPETRPNFGFGYQDYRLDKVVLAKTIQKLIDEGKTYKPDSKNDKAITKQD